MSRRKEIALAAAGVLAGIAISGPAAQAAASLMAAPSGQQFYLDGQRISLEAYEINGSNYVKLRDVGQAVGFGVAYDAATNSVIISPDQPYTKEVEPAPTTAAAPAAPAQSGYTISTDHWSREDFSQQANPSVFTGAYSRELYNTIRQTMVDGTSSTAPAYTMVSKADYSAVKNVIGRMEGVLRYEHYVPQDFTGYWQYPDYFAVSAGMPENYQAPLDFIQPVIQTMGKMTDREKVEYFNDYIRTLLAYEKGKTAGVTQTFAPHNGELKAACGSYAKAMKFLCAAADIPCFTVSSTTHTWNLVYVEGQWLHVDVSANDLSGINGILLKETYQTGKDQAPEATAFLKELYVPGSTK